jgi:hypothetical protein
LEAGDSESFKKELAALEQPDADEADIMQLGSILAQMRDSDPASPAGRQAAAMSLLSIYLSVQRPRTTYYEVNARLALAHLYLDSKRPADARITIQAEKMPETAPRAVAARWEIESKKILQLVIAASATGQGNSGADKAGLDKVGLDKTGKENIK